MQLDQNPFFRKAITPWYDSNLACWLLVGAMALVFLFGMAGIWVGSSHIDFTAHVWFPCFLSFLSLFLVVKVLVRLRRRARIS